MADYCMRYGISSKRYWHDGILNRMCSSNFRMVNLFICHLGRRTSRKKELPSVKDLFVNAW